MIIRAWIFSDYITQHLSSICIRTCVVCKRAGLNLRGRFCMRQLWGSMRIDDFQKKKKSYQRSFVGGKRLMLYLWTQTQEAIHFLHQIIIFLFYHITHIGFILMWVNAVCGQEITLMFCTFSSPSYYFPPVWYENQRIRWDLNAKNDHTVVIRDIKLGIMISWLLQLNKEI